MGMRDSHNTTTAPIDYTTLVQAEQGLVSRRIFIDPDIYQQELARVFGRSWLFLCHASHLPQPGDFFCTYMGEDPVLVTRAKDGQIRAFLNSCRHRVPSTWFTMCRSTALRVMNSRSTAASSSIANGSRQRSTSGVATAMTCCDG